jgi:hypothetical protein
LIKYIIPELIELSLERNSVWSRRAGVFPAGGEITYKDPGWGGERGECNHQLPINPAHSRGLGEEMRMVDKKEINEAKAAAREVLRLLDGVEGTLKSARNWGFFDMFSNRSMISSLI